MGVGTVARRGVWHKSAAVWHTGQVSGAVFMMPTPAAHRLDTSSYESNTHHTSPAKRWAGVSG